ncbi:MAG: antitoxin component YwqK of YwqJK toxin-antitoxin module [Saprospiraceae bacterium]|jgi:antitoxin component YwqK of YwqJK toxin-antitoxin module
MKNRIIILLLLISTISFAQKTKKVKENAGYGKAKFYIFKSDGVTKHGEYKITSYTPPFRNVVLGNYSNGKREGIWTEKYDQSGSQIRMQGNYENDIKVGVWKYYNSKGKLLQEFDFYKNEFITNLECKNKNEYDVETNGVIKSMKLTCPPTRIGGLQIFTKDLYRQITKKSPFEINSSGRTTINIDETLSFFVSKEGNLENIEYSGKEDNDELAKVIEVYLTENNDNWISGKLNDKKVKAKISIPIRIRMMF